MAWEGITFTKQHFSPDTDAMLRRTYIPDCILSGGSLSINGSALDMAPGIVMACGRMLTMDGSWELSDSANRARLVLSIDMASPAPDCFSAYIADADQDGAFDELLQDDINNGGQIYQIALCTLQRGSSGIWGIVDEIARARYA